MYRIKPVFGFVTVAAFLLAIAVGGVDAGALKGKKLLVDTVFNMVEDNADKVNEGVNTVAPSMSMAGDTIKVELFIEDGGGNDIIGGSVKFVDSNMDMMFADSWKIVAVDGIIGVLGAGGIKDDEFTLGGLSAVTIGDNGYFATVKIAAQADIGDGASFYAKHAVIGTASFEQDSLDVSEARVTVETPKGPSIMGMGDDLMAGNMVQIPAMGGSAQVTISLDNLPDDPSISYTVTTTGDGTLSVLDEDGMMLDLDDHMMVTADKIVIKVTGGSLQVTVKATVNGEDTLPVTFTFTQLNPAELAAFDGALQSDRVVLNWSTVSQTNNAGWRVMRSVDGETFQAIGNFVQGAGTADALMNYSFEDQNLPGVDKVYYRLEQVDLDGSISQSNVIEVLLAPGCRCPRSSRSTSIRTRSTRAPRFRMSSPNRRRYRWSSTTCWVSRCVTWCPSSTRPVATRSSGTRAITRDAALQVVFTSPRSTPEPPRCLRKCCCSSNRSRTDGYSKKPPNLPFGGFFWADLSPGPLSLARGGGRPAKPASHGDTKAQRKPGET